MKFLTLIFAFLFFNTECASHYKMPHSSSKKISKIDVKKASEKKSNENNKGIHAKEAILIDNETGDILFAKSATERCAPSSLTKLMTIYMLFSALSEGTITMDQEFYISPLAQSAEGSRSFFRAGQKAKVEDLIRSIVVHSGNDACIIIAEALSGDVESFVEEMNEKAKEFHLKNTSFQNPTGLPNEKHFSCVYDIAVIARHLINDFPEYYHYFSEKTFTINGIKQANRNSLIGRLEGVDGMKTGHTDAGGFGLAASAISSGKRLIAVVNGCENEEERNADASKLLIFGFKAFIGCRICKANQPITFVKVWLGEVPTVALCTHENIFISLPKKYKKKLLVLAKIKEPIEAPIKAGQKLGTLTYEYGSHISKKYNLYACQNVMRGKLVDRAKDSIRYLILGEYQNTLSPKKTDLKDDDETDDEDDED